MLEQKTKENPKETDRTEKDDKTFCPFYKPINRCTKTKDTCDVNPEMKGRCGLRR